MVAGDTPDHSEFVKLSQPHWNAMYRLALQLSKNISEAEDVLQSALLRGMRYFSKFQKTSQDPERAVRFWLLKITRNAFVDSLSYRNKTEIFGDLVGLEGRLSQGELGDARSQQTQEDARPPEGLSLSQAEAEFFRRALTDEIKMALQSLNALQRSVLYLTAEQYTSQEIAEILEVPLGTLLNSRSRRVERLRRLHQKS